MEDSYSWASSPGARSDSKGNPVQVKEAQENRPMLADVIVYILLHYHMSFTFWDKFTPNVF